MPNVTAARTLLVDTVMSPRTVRVRNRDGANTATVSTDPDITAGGNTGEAVASGAEGTFELVPGQRLFGRMPNGQTAELDIV